MRKVEHTMGTFQAEKLAAAAVAFFNQASQDPVLSERMAFADTSVHFHVIGEGPDVGCTLWLNRTPIAAEIGFVGKVEIEIFTPVDVFAGMVTGTEQLAMSIVSGDTTHRGPVRKFLRVVPILQAFDSSAFREWPRATEIASRPKGQHILG